MYVYLRRQLGLEAELHGKNSVLVRKVGARGMALRNDVHFKPLQVTIWAPRSRWTRPSRCRLWGRDQPGMAQGRDHHRGPVTCTLLTCPAGSRVSWGRGCCPPSSRTQLVCLLLAEELGPRMTPRLLVLTAERLNLDVCRQTSRVSLEKLHKAP